MKRGNALNVVEITHFFFFFSYLELPEPLILVMVTKQTLDQKEAGQDLYRQYIGSWEVQGHGHGNTVGSGVDSLVQKTGHHSSIQATGGEMS